MKEKFIKNTGQRVKGGLINVKKILNIFDDYFFYFNKALVRYRK